MHVDKAVRFRFCAAAPCTIEIEGPGFEEISNNENMILSEQTAVGKQRPVDSVDTSGSVVEAARFKQVQEKNHRQRISLQYNVLLQIVLLSGT